MGNKAGMFVYALAFLLGVVFVQQLSVLPDILAELSALILLLASLLCLYTFSYKNLKKHRYDLEIKLILLLIILILLGISYSIACAKQQLSYRLEDNLVAQNILVSGWISGIPVSDDIAQRFEFNVESYRVLKQPSDSSNDSQAPKKIRLSWYYGQQVNAGERWQFEVRLKPPHGFMNPGGFDYEAWLFQHGLHATGYVRKSSFNKQQPKATHLFPEFTAKGVIDRLRQSLSQQIDVISSSKTSSNSLTQNSVDMFALIKALAIGDKSSISKQQWQVLTKTGTSHLMAISGLHIGLAALFAYLLIRRLLPERLMKAIPAQHVALAGGMVAALIYAMLAGLSVPTQRAIIMLFVLSIMMLLRRNHRPLDALGFALLLVLLFDPLAVLSAGFWFSFSAVAVIFISLSSSSLDKTSHADVIKASFLYRVFVKLQRWIKNWVRLQLLISVFLMPMSLLMFQQVSLVSPLANLLLIPYVSFLVVPVVLLALCAAFILPAAAALLFSLAAMSLDLIWPWLLYLSEQPYALWVQGEVDVLKTLLATAAMLLIYFAKDLSLFYANTFLLKQNHKLACWSLRLLAALMIMPLFISHKPALHAAEYQLAILDVGQGSAAVIQTRNHSAVFDAGAKFSDKLDAGHSVVIPYLRSQGIKSLDSLIISHGDADHIGGAQAIIKQYPEVAVIGQDIEGLLTNNKQRCVKGMKWSWDDVDFEFLSPAIEDNGLVQSDKRNNHSCVLQVSSTSGSVLFTGDIEKKAEQKLLETYHNRLSADILIVPHHGSKTSSSSIFIAAVDPIISVFSVGYKNRYKLPNNKVIKRYEMAESRLMQTDNSGAILIKLTNGDAMVVEKYRETARKYWHHRIN